MPGQSVVTIMGCGIAGSWAAHHLCSLGYKRFVLFGGAQPNGYFLERGPITTQQAGNSTAEMLADHLKALSPDADIVAYGDFEPDKHNDQLLGKIIGTMGGMSNCSMAFSESQKRGLSWISIGLPSTPNGSVAIVRDPDELDLEEHFGQTCLSRARVMVACAEFALVIAEMDA